MIRLIASDIDGTLLPYDETVMPQRLFPLIRRLRERNILFCPASGRQYHSMRTLFAPVADEMCFLCENGAVLYGPGTEEGAPLLSKTLLPRQEALALSRAIMDIPGCDVIIEGQNLNYLCGALGVSPEETAAFGDNWNDQAMLDMAGRCYLMEQADGALRRTLADSRAAAVREAPRSCRDVCNELEAILSCAQ